MQAKLSDKWEEFAVKVGPAFQAVLGGALDLLSNVVDVIANLLGLLGKVADMATKITQQTTVGTQTTSPRVQRVPAHAAGGWVGLNGPEIGMLGEKGPEYIVPNGGGTGGGNVNVNVTVQGAALFDPYGQAAQQIAAALAPTLRRELTRQGASLG